MRLCYLPIKAILNWHIANLEYGCASNLNQVGLKSWDQDDPYDYEGDHLLLRDGYTSVVRSFADAAGLDIRLNHQVDKIEHSDSSVRVHCSKLDSDSGEKSKAIDNVVVFDADIVVVTVSLGVLKQG